MRIAICTTDGIEVNEHFGRTGEFYVYDCDNYMIKLVEKRQVSPLSTGDQKHAFDEEKFSVIADIINDCKHAYMTQIGDRPAEELVKRGISPIVYRGRINAIIVDD